MRQRKRLRAGILSSVGTVLVLVLGQGVAMAVEGSSESRTLSASLDDPIGTVASTLDDPIDIVTDTVDGTTDTVTDAVDETTDAVTDAVDGTTDTVTNTVDRATDTIGGAPDDGVVSIGGTLSGWSGKDDPVGTTARGADTSFASPTTSSASRGPRASPEPRVAAMGPSDLDEVAEGGNDVVEGSDDAVCVGAARVVCVGLVGGLGALGILFPTEEAGEVVDAFVDALARTGIDLLGVALAFVALTLLGSALVSRRPASTQAGIRRPLVEA